MQTTPKHRTPRLPTPRAVHRRTRPAVALSLTAGLLATGCSMLSPDGGREAAERVAAALAAGGLEELDFANVEGPAAQEEYEQVTGGLGDAAAAVEVAGVDDAGAEEAGAQDRRVATLTWTWDLPGTGQDWSYDSALPLVRTESGGWAPEWSPAVVQPSLQEGGTLRSRAVAADRGDILGVDGETLVTERPIRRVGIDKAQLDGTDPGEAARRLAAVVDVDADAYAEAVQQAGPDAFVEALTLREEAFRELDARRLEEVPGLLAVEGEMPLAPSRGFAADLLGGVAEATAEEVAESGGELAAGTVVGRGGVQERFDDRLRGTPGVVVEAVVGDAGGQGGPGPGGEASPGEPLYEVPAQAGEPVTVTLDRGLQATAEELLAGIESPSAVVAVRPSTGELVASANGPGSAGYSTALLGQYAPGSTFKVVTALAMLREGDTPETVVRCPPSTTAAGVRIDNAESYPAEFTGSITLTEAIAHSCNTAFVDQHDRISQAELAAAAAALGIGTGTDLGVPAFSGAVPEEEEPAQHAVAMFGQGRTLVSPLSMANLTASVAAGRLVTPRLVDTEGLLEEDATPGPAPEEPLTAEEAEQLRTMMRAVVTSGHLDVLQGLEPDTAVGKTGTAEYGDEDPPRTHSWVIAEHDDLAVAVFVEDGDLGSVTGGPIARDFLQEAAASGAA
ncbi:penicillin-binding transpeptidase domain-containing protein [Kocuria kalidii]|uniref:penicillin-binding transpeptidase domain-containing protein n=1 Tax=Kocuria kalidii TaxID=3376283 RepID=UPI0037970E80